MRHPLFDAESRRVLLAPRSWRFVTSLLECEAEPLVNRGHEKWMASHVDRHPAREILVALKGRGAYGFCGKVYPCVPGTIFLFDSYEPHDRFYAPGGPRLRHLWLYILGNDVMARVVDSENGHILWTSKPPIILSGTEAATLLIATWRELAEKPRLPKELLRAKLVAGLAATLAQVVEEGYTDPSEAAGQDFAAVVIRTVRQHVEEHAGRGIPLAEAARLAGYSKFHFLRLFKAHTGMTYHAFVDACRIQTARTLLGAGRRRKEVAAILGFSHSSAFLRWMKKQEQHWPPPT